MLIDRVLPKYDFSDVHSREVEASPERLYAAIFETDFSHSATVRILMAVRSLPATIRAGFRQRPREPVKLRDLQRSGFVVLAEDAPHEVLLGLEGRFWELEPEVCESDAAVFNRAVTAGMARAVWNFTVAPQRDNRSILATETRILCADEGARRHFAGYWRFVQPGSALIRRALLRAIAKQAR